MTSRCQRLMKIFYDLDADGNGEITTRELEEGLRRRGVCQQKIQEMLCNLDLNGDGTITINEYRLAVGLTGESLKIWKDLFRSLDVDRDGYLTIDELYRMFDGSGATILRGVIEAWMEDNDVNHDGKLSYQEYIAFVTENLL